MVISTRLGEMLKIRHPILLAPMDVVADGKPAAEVIDRMVKRIRAACGLEPLSRGGVTAWRL
jgi:NAD(P)H-dependent flavin oxidoreductase YrpB (nitropropane dioxygenase family)